MRKVKESHIERKKLMKTKYIVLLAGIGALIFITSILILSNIIFRAEIKRYCLDLPVHQFYQNDYCLEFYNSEVNEK